MRAFVAWAQRSLGRSPYWVVLLFFFVASLVFLWPLPRHGNDLIIDMQLLTPFGTSDSFLFAWNIWWFKESVLGLSNPFFSDGLFYPETVNLSLATHSYGYALVALPWLLLFGDFPGITYAFTFIIIVSFTLTGYFMFRLAMCLELGTVASIAAGAFYSFGSFHTANLTRLHLLCLELVPLALWLLVLVLRSNEESVTRRQAILRGLGLGFVVAFLAYTSQTFTVHFILYAAMLTPFVLWHQRDGLSHWKLPIAVVSSMIVFFSLAWPQIYYTLALVGQEAMSEYRPIPLDIKELFTPNRAIWAYFQLHRLGAPEELSLAGHPHFPGYLMVAAAIAAIALRRFRPARSSGGGWPWLLIAVLGFVLALGPETESGLTLPMGYAYEVWSGFKVDRAPIRYIHLTYFAGVLAAGAGASILIATVRDLPSRYMKIGLLIAIALAFLAENRWSWDGDAARMARLQNFVKPDQILAEPLDAIDEIETTEALTIATMPVGNDTKHTLYVQLRTGARVIAADYPRFAHLDWHLIKDAGLYEYFDDTRLFADASVNEKQAVCRSVQSLFHRNNVGVAYVSPPPSMANFMPILADRVLGTDSMLKTCAARVAYPPVRSHLPASLYFFPIEGDPDFLSKVEAFLLTRGL